MLKTLTFKRNGWSTINKKPFLIRTTFQFIWQYELCCVQLNQKLAAAPTKIHQSIFMCIVTENKAAFIVPVCFRRVRPAVGSVIGT